jgi:sulfite exporter TauE/SafE
MATLTLTAALILGLASSLHCVAMCGGIIGALSLSVGGTAGRAGRLVYVAGYNLGRIGSYAVAGALSGSVAGLLFTPDAGTAAHRWLQILSGILLVAIGLQLGGWVSWLGFLEAAGARLWRWLQPAGRLFLPVDSLPKALLLGALWGWIPCGLVYATLAWTAVQADPLFSAAAMATFGLGTLPSMLTAGLAAGHVGQWRDRRRVRRAAAVLIILLGVVSAAVPLLRDPHPAHLHHPPAGSGDPPDPGHRTAPSG